MGLVLALALVLASQAAARLSLVSRNSAGTPANGDSTVEGGGSALSGNGRVVVFFSSAANLPGGDGSTYRVYARNMRSRRTSLMSATSAGVPASGDVFGAAASGDGRFVAFYGQGDGLPGAHSPKSQVWIHDRRTGTTRLVSRAGDGTPGDGDSRYPSISANGRFVAFQSDSGNLPGGDGSNTFAYLRDMRKRRTILITRTSAGKPVSGGLYGQSVSSNGRRVTFLSADASLPGGDGSTDHVYLRDLRARRTLLVDRTSAGKVAGGDSSEPSVSGNGRFVAFDSHAPNLGAGTSNEQVILRDIKRRRTRMVSRTSGGQKQNGDAYLGHPSGNGRYVVFESGSTNLPGGSGLSEPEIYVRDMRKGRTRLLSRAANGDPANAYCDYPSISLDGRWSVFYSGATNLGGTPLHTDVFRAGQFASRR